MYVCAMHMCGAHRGLQGALDPLGLELQIVGATKPRSGRAVSAFNRLATSPATASAFMIVVLATSLVAVPKHTMRSDFDEKLFTVYGLQFKVEPIMVGKVQHQEHEVAGPCSMIWSCPKLGNFHLS